jgi:GntR family transcriptional regulator/MocR family aminotransferase
MAEAKRASSVPKKGAPAGSRRRSRAAWEHILGTLDRSNGPLHDQLVRAFVAAIEAEKVPAGLRVPSGRDLAAMLGIGRNTAMLAISDLVQRGYMIARSRSGTYIGDRPARPRVAKDVAQTIGEPDWAARLRLGNMTERESLPISAATRSDIDFRYGQFDADLFPVGDWRECERAALSVMEIAHWGRDMVDGDDIELIDCMRKYILPDRGIWASADEIIVTMGGQEGRYLIAQALCRQGATVGVEYPGMPDMVKILDRTGAQIRPLELDTEGLVCSPALDGCDVVVTTCGHQCPTTAVMSRTRRLELLSRAKSEDIVFVEDTYDTDLISDDGVPSLYGLDSGQRVIHISSLSKLIAPGLRIGFVVAPTPVIHHLRELRRLIHRHPPGNNQRALTIFIQQGFHRAYLQRVTKELEARTEALLAALARHLPEFTYRHRSGTASFWIAAPPQVDTAALAVAASKLGVFIEPGHHFFSAALPLRNFLRMAVSSVRIRNIEAGIERLAEAYRSLQ